MVLNSGFGVYLKVVGGSSRYRDFRVGYFVWFRFGATAPVLHSGHCSSYPRRRFMIQAIRFLSDSDSDG